jgi:hypothetical protein
LSRDGRREVLALREPGKDPVALGPESKLYEQPVMHPSEHFSR